MADLFQTVFFEPAAVDFCARSQVHTRLKSLSLLLKSCVMLAASLSNVSLPTRNHVHPVFWLSAVVRKHENHTDDMSHSEKEENVTKYGPGMCDRKGSVNAGYQTIS